MCAFNFGKIPGHSGSSQKNKKAFKLKKERKQSEKAKYKEGWKLEKPYSMSHAKDKYSKKLQIISGFILILFSIIAGICVRNRMVTYEAKIAKEYQLQELKRIAQENEEQYKMIAYYKKQGQCHLDKFNLNAAKDHYEILLKLDSTNKEGVIGLTKTLQLQCDFRDKFCNEAKEYYEYVEIYYPKEIKQISKALILSNDVVTPQK